MPLGTAVYWTPAAFLAASAVAILAGVVVPTHALLSRGLVIAIGALLVALPLIRLASGGPGWPAAIASGQLAIIATDIAMLAAGTWTLWQVLAGNRRPIAGNNASLQPAE
jgi:hypothetical protein